MIFTCCNRWLVISSQCISVPHVEYCHAQKFGCLYCFSLQTWIFENWFRFLCRIKARLVGREAISNAVRHSTNLVPPWRIQGNRCWWLPLSSHQGLLLGPNKAHFQGPCMYRETSRRNSWIIVNDGWVRYPMFPPQTPTVVQYHYLRSFTSVLSHAPLLALIFLYIEYTANQNSMSAKQFSVYFLVKLRFYIDSFHTYALENCKCSSLHEAGNRMYILQVCP